MSSGLVQRLRRDLRDERYKSAAFELTITDESVTEAIIEITNQRFIVNVTGGSAVNLDIDLSSDRYVTIGLLAKEIDGTDGYKCSIDDDAEFDHLSSDLEPMPPTDFTGQSAVLNTRRFSDEELLRFVEDAIQRHNPSYGVDSLPREEEVFVLNLAKSMAFRTLASDAVKRKGMDETVENLVSLADSFESLYDKDIERLQRVIPSPKLTPRQQNAMREGDVVVGQAYRRSSRNGYNVPQGADAPPSTPVLLDPIDGDVEDNNATLRWLKNPDGDFYTYELWRDTQPNVQRSRNQVLYGEREIPLAEVNRDRFDKPTTSKLVFKSYGPNQGSDDRMFVSFVEAYGQQVVAVVDRGALQEGLESNTEYFYRLYVVDLNGNVVGSPVMRLRTLVKRARFTDEDYVSPVSADAAGGTSITINANRVVAGCVAYIGGKALNSQVVTPGSPGTIVGTLPAFDLEGDKDIVIKSPTGLDDIRYAAFEVT